MHKAKPYLCAPFAGTPVAIEALRKITGHSCAHRRPEFLERDLAGEHNGSTSWNPFRKFAPKSGSMSKWLVRLGLARPLASGLSGNLHMLLPATCICYEYLSEEQNYVLRKLPNSVLRKREKQAHSIWSQTLFQGTQNNSSPRVIFFRK